MARKKRASVKSSTEQCSYVRVVEHETLAGSSYSYDAKPKLLVIVSCVYAMNTTTPAGMIGYVRDVLNHYTNTVMVYRVSKSHRMAW